MLVPIVVGRIASHRITTDAMRSDAGIQANIHEYQLEYQVYEFT